MGFMLMRKELFGFPMIFCFCMVFVGRNASADTKPVVVENITVEIKKFAFVPAEITVPLGTTVRWINAEKRQYHSVWFESLDKEEADYFFPEETHERTFNKVGTYHYRCGPHERMKGTVIVTAK